MLEIDPKAHGKLWKWIRSNCAVPIVSHEIYYERSAEISSINSEVLAGKYQPSPPVGFLSTPKLNGVPRFVPIMNYRDLTVFYGCVLGFENDLAKHKVQNTFGGWSLGGKARLKETEYAEELKKIEVNYYPYGDVPTYYFYSWFKEWKGYWQVLLATLLHRQYTGTFVSFDIANFYDSISLSILESKLRQYCGNKQPTFNLLMYLLRNQNKKENLYMPASHGIPQEFIGDCSRVLANFYLIPFDEAIREYCDNKGYDYIRWSDDFVIWIPGEDNVEQLIYEVGRILFEYQLNLNAAKTSVKSAKEFNDYWMFDCMKAIELGDVKHVKRELKRAIKGEAPVRIDVTLKRLLGAASELKDEKLTKFIFNRIINSHEVLALDYKKLDKLAKCGENYLSSFEVICKRILSSPFTMPYAQLVRLIGKYYRSSHNDSLIRVMASVLRELKNLEIEVVDFCIDGYSLSGE